MKEPRSLAKFFPPRNFAKGRVGGRDDFSPGK